MHHYENIYIYMNNIAVNFVKSYLLPKCKIMSIVQGKHSLPSLIARRNNL